MQTRTESFAHAAHVDEVRKAGRLVVALRSSSPSGVNVGHTILLIHENDKIYAVDNRCPHMGFPLHRGTVKDCILTCDWHYARFDLMSGGTFDSWADDLPAFPVEIRENEVWIDLAAHADPLAHHRQRLQDGLEQGIPLIISKSVIALLKQEKYTTEAFRMGLDFGVSYRQSGWDTGLTIHTCMMNLLPYLDAIDKPRALYHGLAAVARDTSNQPPRFPIQPLPGSNNPEKIPVLQHWFRQFVEVRDAEGAERCLASAIAAGASQTQLAQMLFTVVTDHRYIDVGHPLDFTNKALEALDATAWQNAELVLTSLVSGYTSATRMEESRSWRSPVDLAAILQQAFAELPAALAEGKNQQGSWGDRDSLLPILLGDNAQAIADSLLTALRQGCSEVDLAGIVTHATALRIAQFSTNNDFNDWDSAHHTFTFANAVHQGMKRVASAELLRGVFDAAMSVYLDRFLNVPAARLPNPDQTVEDPAELLHELPELLDRQQQVNRVGELVGSYLYSGGKPELLLALLGKLLLREDRQFHVIQEIEAAFRQYSRLGNTPAGIHVLVAASRYLAAHTPTMRSQEQTYQMAYRLHRGDRLFEDVD
ncbi:Rieske (2Fe-2S) protein [Myxacorys almedinensis]|uniref:Rieske 2Fe-2S domain-containing protein n=1 Tax=Myxacorys almedinensis A TaxID=2690445 RepID=A0A8J7Z7R8_9CYAN|nr:Rieske (2Fe-2S) protein [Myxacorys almedinensis]NDJ19481.1 Rieske 2Fe-2S domain-containing protein [Myxacorys almedinensis A]